MRSLFEEGGEVEGVLVGSFEHGDAVVAVDDLGGGHEELLVREQFVEESNSSNLCVGYAPNEVQHKCLLLFVQTQVNWTLH